MKKLIKILLAEDSQSDARLIWSTISKTNIEFEKEHVETEKDYISALKLFIPDLILSDFSMPQFDGMTALRIRNEITPETPFLIVTGAQNEEIAVECMKEGADDYIIKQNLSRLGEAIKSAIHKKDIIKQKKIIEENLRLSEDRFKAVSEIIGEWVWEINADGLFKYVSPVSYSLLGYTPDEIVDKKYFFDFFISESKEELKAKAFDIISRKEAFKSFEHQCIHKDGRRLYVETSGSPILDSKNNLIGYRGADKNITGQKFAMEMLRRSEEKFIKAFQNTPNAISITRASDGLLVEINDSFVNLFEYLRDEAIGQTSIDLNLWANGADRANYISIIKEEGRIRDFETLFRTKSGDIRNISISGESYEMNGEYYILNILRDITEHKLDENQIRESEEKYRALFESSSIAIMLTSPDGSILSANESACDLFNMTEEEICSSGRSGLVDLNDPALPYLLEQRSRTGKSKGQLSFYKKGGIKFPAEVSSVVFTNKEGNKLTSMVLRDLTEQKKSEEALKKSEARLRSYFDFSGVGVAITSPSTGWVEVNDKLCRMLDYSSEEIYKSTWPQLTHPDDLDIDLEYFSQVISGKIDEYSIDKRFLRKDGETVWTNLSVSCVRDQNGQVDYFVALLFDITDRKRVEAELINAKQKAEESDKLKTAFLHNISHEIRTPLNAILGFGALLSDPGISNEEQTSYLGSIQDGSDQLLSIITTLLDISSAEARVLKMNETSFNINSTLRSLHKQFLLKTSENSNTLELNLGLNDEHAIIRSDSTRLIQIISNLLVNAFKFTSNGKIEYGYKTRESELEFYVFDSGIGIPSDQHSRIFDSFYQVQGALNRKYGGTGLGLSICKAYVELLGGKIWVNSTPGSGSQFYFTIPFYETPTLQSLKPAEKKVVEIGNEASLTILVVEDNDINFSLIVGYLSGQNMKLLKAQNGKEAVDICSSVKEIDIVLMDIRMPVMDGYTAAKKIKEIRPDLPIIAQTAYADEKEQYLNSGFTGLLAKPFTKNHLLDILEKNLVK